MKIFSLPLNETYSNNANGLLKCISPIEKEILKLNGVKEARVNYMTKTVKVIYDSD